MYRLLIVDDEPHIANGVFDLVQSQSHFQFDLVKAYNGLDALERLNGGRVDIVITDINMPVINGIELHRRIQSKWPRCKVIFLTGFAEFSYIQEATRTGGVIDYLLKNENEKQLIFAVEKAVVELDQELENHYLVEQARSKLSQAIPHLRSKFIAELLEGRPFSHSQLQIKCMDLEISLEVDKPFVILLGKAVDPGQKFETHDTDLLLFSVRNIVSEFISSRQIHMAEAQNRTTYIWLLQPADTETISEMISFLYGTMEMVQECCSKFLGSSISFVMGGRGVEWNNASVAYSRLEKLLLRQIGAKEALVIDSEDTWGEASKLDQTKQLFQQKVRQIDQLRNLLDTGQEKEFLTMLDEQFELDVVEPNEYMMEWLTGLYYIFISFINRYDLNELVSERVQLARSLPMLDSINWQDTADSFRALALALFQAIRSTREEAVNHTVKIVMEYVEAHLAEDLSLTQISSIVYHSPTYFSKLFKQSVGIGFNEYVSDIRLSKASALLVSTNLKVQDIAIKTGYESATYFSKAFKRKFSISPNEYRERN